VPSKGTKWVSEYLMVSASDAVYEIELDASNSKGRILGSLWKFQRAMKHGDR